MHRVDVAGQPHWTVDWNGECYTGYWALCAAINRAISEGIPITTASFYSTIDEETLAHVFRSSTVTMAPMFSTRLKHLKEVGTIVCRKYEGRFSNAVKVKKKLFVEQNFLLLFQFY